VKIALGVPTFNRRQFVELHAKSLCASRLPSERIIIVLDDASTEYGAEYLQSLFPKGSDVRRRASNSGAADYAIRNVMELLLSTDADAMMILDSDMLVAEDFLEVGTQLLPQTDGILSLFNTPSHPAYGFREPFVLKKTIGSAGTLWRRDVAEKMFASVAPGFKWDWRFCAFLTDAGYEICVTRNSLVQHLGFAAGENSKPLSGDYGTGFSDNDSRGGYAILEQTVLSSQLGFRQLLNTIGLLEKRIDLLQEELNICKQNAGTPSGKLEIEALRRTFEAELGELVRAEGRLSGRVNRVERMLGVRLFDRLSRSLLKSRGRS
jgi:Glycosyl transferase family 2